MNYIKNDSRLNEIIDNFNNLILEYKQEDILVMFTDVPENIKILMLIYACGICHNMNWDYLCNNFMYKLKLYSKDFDTDFLADIDESVINNSIEVFKEDPLHKKTNLLAQIFINDKIITVEDEYNIEPLVDYHIMRLYLRTGRIKIVNEDLKEKIMKKEQLHLVQITELRRMIAEQIKRFCNDYVKKEQQTFLQKRINIRIESCPVQNSILISCLI